MTATRLSDENDKRTKAIVAQRAALRSSLDEGFETAFVERAFSGSVGGSGKSVVWLAKCSVPEGLSDLHIVRVTDFVECTSGALRAVFSSSSLPHAIALTRHDLAERRHIYPGHIGAVGSCRQLWKTLGTLSGGGPSVFTVCEAPGADTLRPDFGRALGLIHTSLPGELGRAVVDRLRELRRDFYAEEAEDPAVDSLVGLAAFFAEYGDVKPPVLVLTPDGDTVARWKLDKQTLLSLHFLSASTLRYVCFLPDLRHPDQTLRMSGTAAPDSLADVLPARAKWILRHARRAAT